jgi:hypothetical protein
VIIKQQWCRLILYIYIYILCFNNVLTFNRYFTKHYKLAYRKKYGYCKFNHQYNICPIHLQTLLGVRNFTKVVRVCADRL